MFPNLLDIGVGFGEKSLLKKEEDSSFAFVDDAMVEVWLSSISVIPEEDSGYYV